MFRLLGYLCNDATLNAAFFKHGLEHLEIDAVDVSSGLGLGWVQDGRSLLRTMPRPSRSSATLEAMLGDIPARSLIAHSRDTSDEPAATLDLQPFRYRRWVYAHAGELPASKELRSELLGNVPEFIAGNVKGDSGEEIMFHLFVAKLHEESQLDGHTHGERCAAAMAHAVVDAQQVALASYAGIAVSERLMVFASAGVPVWYREVRGLSEAREKPLFAGHRPKPIDHASFKALMVVQADDSPGESWERAPDGQVGWMERDWKLRFRDIQD